MVRNTSDHTQLPCSEPRVSRSITLPLPMFEKLKAAQRKYRTRTNGETVELLLGLAEQQGWLSGAPPYVPVLRFPSREEVRQRLLHQQEESILAGQDGY